MIRLLIALVLCLSFYRTSANDGDGVCPDQIVIDGANSLPEIGYFCFYIPGIEPGTIVNWNFGDGYFDSGIGEICHGYFQLDVEYSVTVTAMFSDDDCTGGGGFLSLNIVIEAASYGCIPEITGENITIVQVDCDTYTFTSSTYPTGNYTYQWDLNGDGFYPDANEFLSSVTYSYDSPGTYTIGLIISGQFPWPEECNLVELTIGDCPDCPSEILAFETGCHEYTFVTDLPLEGTFEWQFGDGAVQQWNGLVQHTYADTGTYSVCVNALSDECGAISFCQDIVVSWCVENTACPSLEVIPLGCGTYHFEIGYTGDPTQLYADAGDGIPAVIVGNTFDHQFTLPGTYYASVGTNEFDCPDTVVPIVIEELCDCLESVSFETDCFSANIEVEVPGESVLHWMSEGMNFYGDSTQTISYTEPGYHEVCIHYQNALCEMSEYYCFNVLTELCVGICPDTILHFTADASLYSFTIPGAENAGTIEWNFGDGSPVVNDDLTAEHVFEPGTYTVTAILMDPDCPWDGPYVLDLDIEVYTCAIELSAVEGENGMFTISALGSPEVYPMLWDFGDGSSMEATWVVDHVFEPGTYTVCGSIASELCPDTVSACLMITYGTELCTHVDIHLQSDVLSGGPAESAWEIVDEFATVVYGGVVNFSNEVSEFDTTFCLPDDCYYFTYCITDVEWVQESFSWSLTTDGMPVNYVGFSETTPCGEVHFFSINGPCEEEFCNADFTFEVSPDFPGLVSFNNLSTTTDIEISWDFGNGTTSNELAPELQFTENGTYVVCCTVTFGDCTDSACNEVVITGLGEDCYNLALEIISNYSSGAAEDEIELVVTTPGGFSATYNYVLSESNSYVPLYFCLEDSCFQVEITDLDSDMQAASLSLEWTWMDEPVSLGNWSLDVTEASWVIQTGVSEACWTSNVANGQYPLLILYPNPASDVIAMEGLTPGQVVQIRLLDMAGRTLLEQNSSKGQILHVKDVPAGMYICRILAGDKTYYYPLIIKH